MENTTINTYLYHSATESGTYAKLLDITSYPDIFTAPEKLDVSDLSSNCKKYVPGMVDLPDYEFEFIYNKAAYAAVKALEGDNEYYQIRFGVNGEYGAWQWQGDIFATPVGAGVGAVRTGKVVCYPKTEPTEVTITTTTTP